MPTSTILAILNDPYTRGVDGADYEPYRFELEQELWRRDEKKLADIEADMRRQEREYHAHLKAEERARRTQKTASKKANA